MRPTENKTPHYSMLLICEGKRTEPNFFGAMAEWLVEEEKIDFNVDILPKPTISHDDNELDLNRGAAGIRKKRLPNNDTPIQQELEKADLFLGPPPLNWVEAGIKQLYIYDEVWAVFDKDEHPAIKDAFHKAQSTEVERKKINIAFSSRCFEYYLLLHFEYIYKAFDKSECNSKEYSKNGKKSKTVSYHCMTSRAVEGKACQGDKCINGYARLKGYWEESKGIHSTFLTVKDKLWTGIYNAHSVRWKSNMLLPETDFYTRNPYVDTDKLTCRLLGYGTIEHEESISIRNGNNYCQMTREKDIITFTLESDTTIVIPAESMIVYNNLTGRSREAGIRLMLTPEQTVQILDLQSIMIKDEYCIITLFTKSYFCTLLPDEESLV